MGDGGYIMRPIDAENILRAIDERGARGEVAPDFLAALIAIAGAGRARLCTLKVVVGPDGVSPVS